MYNVSIFGQIVFSSALFMFWLVFADGMTSTGAKPFMSFYLPKLCLVILYMAMASLMFLLHGRVPDRVKIMESGKDPALMTLVVFLSASLIGLGVWLSFLVSRAIYRLGWKKVEYIYTEREKSFVGITIVFVILSLCGHLYRAVHGRRGSWMQLQLPFLTLTNSYLTLLTHAFWPSDQESTAPAEGGESYDNEEEFMEDDERSKGKGL